MASMMLAGGQGKRRAVAAAGGLGLATVLGVLLTGVTAPLAAHGLAISAGVTLYVAASNLVPEFQAKRGLSTALAFFGGAALFVATRALLTGWLPR
jgi:ZIP family zinc transporter/zinc and cadmium transporter